MGYTGFTLVMPFLPLFIGQLGVADGGPGAMWTVGAGRGGEGRGGAVGAIIGGLLAQVVGLRRAFLATAMFYAAGLVLVHLMYDDRAVHAQPSDMPETGRVTFRNVLAFQNF